MWIPITAGPLVTADPAVTAGSLVGSGSGRVLILRNADTGEFKTILTNPGGTVYFDGVLYGVNGKPLNTSEYTDFEFYGGGFERGTGYGTYLATCKDGLQRFVSVRNDDMNPFVPALYDQDFERRFVFDHVELEFFKGTFLENFHGQAFYLAVGPGNEYSYIIRRALYPLVNLTSNPINPADYRYRFRLRPTNEELRGMHSAMAIYPHNFYLIYGLPEFSEDRKICYVESYDPHRRSCPRRRFATDLEFLNHVNFHRSSGFPFYCLD